MSLSPALAARFLAASFLASVAAAQDADWPSFRGKDARGYADGPAPPVEWDVETGKNIAWRTPVPGLAHSSPVVWNGRVYVTTAVRAKGDAELSSLYGSPGYGAGESVEDEGEHHFRLLALDAATGEVLWTKTAHTGVPKTKRHPKSSHANSTPAVDGERVVAFFGSEGLYAYDHDGELLWKRDLGVLDAGAPRYPNEEDFQWGFASSPVLHGDRVIVQCDVQGQSFLASLDADTGEDVWRVDREEEPTWCTPTVHDPGGDGRAQVIVNGYDHIGGYDLATGEEVWKLVGGGDVPVPTPVVAGDLIFITSAHGRYRPIYAVRTDAEGEVTNDPETCEAMQWCQMRSGVYMQTPLILGDLLFCCSDGGVLRCYDAATGTRHYSERLGGGRTGFSGSLVSAGGLIYLSGESGSMFVVRAGEAFELLAENELGETCMSTPAISAGRLFVRSRGHVICIAETAGGGADDGEDRETDSDLRP